MVAAEWIDRVEYPFSSNWFDVGKKRLHYVDEGVGEPVVFLHGSPGWSFSFRHLIKGLRSQFRCLAPDLLGFGLSDKPTNWTYRPERDVEYITDFIETKNLKDVTLVLHGMGGPIGIDYALKNPSNIRHIVVINTWMWPLTHVEAIQKIDKRVNGVFGRFLYLNMNGPVRSMKRAVQDRTHFDRTAFEHYWNALDEPVERVAPYGYDKALTGSSHFFQSLWDRREAIRHVPALILWGMADRVLPHNFIEQWRMVFPEAEFKKLSNCGPNVMEEKGPGLIPHVEMFLNDTAYLPTATLM